MIAKLSICCLLAVAIVQTSAYDRGKLKLIVSGRNLPDKDTGFGTSDVYFELFSSIDGGRTKTKILRTDTISNQENPDWGSLVQLDFDRNQNMLLFFYVWDEDNLREDDTVGRAWVSVNDFVDKGQLTNANLDKGRGYLIIKSVETLPPPSANGKLGKLPLPLGTPQTMNLIFKVSASGLATKDDVGFIPGNGDPYVIITSTDGLSGSESTIGRTSTVTGTTNPNWGDAFSFNWNMNKDQRWHFKIYDDDKLREDDRLGAGWIEVTDYVAKGQSYTLKLAKKGTLTITRA